MSVIFVAEIGMNCDGNFNLNYELIRQAKWAGADIAKFQVGWRGKKNEINFMNEERLLQLKEWCIQFDIELMVSIFNEESLDLVKKVGMKRYKIASRTVIDNPDLCRKIIAEGSEVFISLGMWNEISIPFEGQNIKYLYCKSKYPTRYDDLKDFPLIFKEFYGYSDHLMGIEGCLLAISRGAKLIEKHFTLNKTSQVIGDHALSSTPEEFKVLTSIGRDLHNIYDKVL
jgi:N,N'-diacetyllegionaminate synthase